MTWVVLFLWLPLADWILGWPLLRWPMIQCYGIYGGLRPPMYGCRFYWLRRQWWKLTNAVYTISGVPAIWLDWMKEEGD